MHFDGKAIQLTLREPGFAELRFDLKGESVNKFNQLTLGELNDCVTLLVQSKDIKGLLVTSGKGVFIVGADINEFLPNFKKPEPELVEWISKAQAVFSRLEDLPFPSVAAINGYALGGGLEAAMACTYRVASTAAVVGQPEIKLGILPGFGGTVRLPRLVGVDNAIEMIASGRDVKADEALKLKLVAAVVAPERLAEAALGLLKREAAADRWQKVRDEKKSPVRLNGIERLMAFNVAKAFVGAQAGRNYPAPVESIKVMESAAHESREVALAAEAKAFAKLAKTEQAAGLIGIFHADQFLKKKSKQQTGGARAIGGAAVLGAGIMGGGIAYQSASRGVPVLLKDIKAEAIEQGYAEASRLLDRQVERGRITRADMARALSTIQATYSYGDFGRVDIAVEAVVENPKVKQQVLAETEAALGEQAVLATNTSTIPIDSLAGALKHPERFCGMHFFNPVHRMPLVEVIRGKASSDETIATVVAYALKLGKTPIVVKDGPGFLVNRILGPYMLAFQMLVAHGAPIETLDKTMERWGWPMGPATLSDVVGLDTAHHAGEVMAAAFPDRIRGNGKSPTTLLYEAGCYGQKNGKGYYSYTKDKRGRDQKAFDPAVLAILKPAITGGAEQIEGDAVVERMMLPMIIEASRCLEDGIVETPTELDMSLVLGLGFPPFRGGLLRWADSLGAEALMKLCDTHGALGPLYAPTQQMKDNAQAGKGFYPPA
ncbi:MAG TPA: fatty acid oxidation complex subunit alpha FadB [bacterium]|nr:fatty acid oxidation complex subunit alpha FadB [bacterium]